MAKFNTEQAGNSLVVRCEDHLNHANGQEGIEIIQGAFDRAKISGSGIIRIVLDLREKFEFDHAFLRGVSRVALEMRKHGIALLALGVPPTARNLLKETGMDSAIRVVTLEDLSEKKADASAPAARKSPAIDVAFINPFLEGVLHVLKVQCSLDATGKPLALKDPNQRYTSDIAGVIGIVSKSFSGSVSICFPSATFLGIMSRMLGEEYTEITRDLEDGAGELLNMIFGHAKKVLNEKGYTLDKAIPTIVRGDNIEMRQISPGPTVILPFTSPVGDFRVEVSVDRPFSEKN